MGEQIHVGGKEQTTFLAEKLKLDKINYKKQILDICSALGGPARQLVQDYNVKVLGLDITPKMIEEAKNKTKDIKYAEKIEYRLGSGLDIPSHKETFDIVWGQDAWCYIRDKPRLIQEIYRVLKPGGKLGFTDWIWGTRDPPENEADYLMEFMVFPDLETIDGYCDLIQSKGLNNIEHDDLGPDFARYMDVYLNILRENAKPIIDNFGESLYLEAEKGVVAWNQAAKENWVSRGFWIAEKPD